MKRHLGIFLAFACSFSVQASSPLSIDDYVRQVRKSNQAVQGSSLNSQGALERSSEGDLLLAPQLFSNIQHTDDHKPTLIPVFQGDRTVTDYASLGISKLTDFGLQSSLTYSLTRNHIYDASPALVTNPELSFGALSLQLTQSLLKNGFGESTRANEKVLNSQAKSTAFVESYNVKNTIADAQARYWRLAVARAVIQVENESLDRAEKIRDFNARRARLELADQADVLQSDANLKQRQLDLKSALNDERSARRAFNLARNEDSDDVSEELSLPDPDRLRSLPVPARAEKRDDVKAAEESVNVAVASSEVARQNQLPQLDLYGGYTTNGQDPTLGNAAGDSFSTKNPTAVVGVKFSVPLDQGGVHSVRAGYVKGELGAEKNYQQKLFQQESDWKDLVEKFSEAKDRLAVAVEVKVAQKAKLERERTRQRQGQSTTYQVFLFEQDYLNSELSFIQNQAQILTLAAQMETYKGDL